MIESGFGSISEIKEFYLNDIILYYRNTYKKVNKMYEEYKARKNGDILKSSDKCLGNNNNKLENDVNDLDEFMKDNELYVKKFLFVSFSNLKKKFQS